MYDRKLTSSSNKQAEAAQPIRLFNNQFQHHQYTGWKREIKAALVTTLVYFYILLANFKTYLWIKQP